MANRKGQRCACGVTVKAHKRKSRRGQIPGLATTRRGYAVKSLTVREVRYRIRKALDKAAGRL